MIEPAYHEWWAGREDERSHCYVERNTWAGRLSACHRPFEPRIRNRTNALRCQDCVAGMLDRWVCEDCEAPASDCLRLGMCAGSCGCRDTAIELGADDTGPLRDLVRAGH